jgi:hypothetical protein
MPRDSHDSVTTPLTPMLPPLTASTTRMEPARAAPRVDHLGITNKPFHSRCAWRQPRSARRPQPALPLLSAHPLSLSHVARPDADRFARTFTCSFDHKATVNADPDELIWVLTRDARKAADLSMPTLRNMFALISDSIEAGNTLLGPKTFRQVMQRCGINDDVLVKRLFDGDYAAHACSVLRHAHARENESRPSAHPHAYVAVRVCARTTVFAESRGGLRLDYRDVMRALVCSCASASVESKLHLLVAVYDCECRVPPRRLARAVPSCCRHTAPRAPLAHTRASHHQH